MTNPPNIRTTLTNRAGGFMRYSIAGGVMGYPIESGVTGYTVAGEVT